MITWEDNQFLIPHTYDLIYESSKEKVYKNSLDMSLGYASSKISGFNILENLDKSQERHCSVKFDCNSRGNE